MRAKGNANGNLFATNLTLTNPIVLPSPGRYKLTVNTLVHCPYALCDNADDLIQIKMKEDGATDFEKLLLKTGIETGRLRDRKWILEEVFFYAETEKINV